MNGLVARALIGGLALGLSFNVVAAAVGAVLAAILGTLKARRGGGLSLPAALVVLAAWLVGDGLEILIGGLALVRRGTALLGPGAPAWLTALVLAEWALVGLLVGYALPAALGVAVGRRVHWGTGWLSSGAVALAAVGALGVLGSAGASAMHPFFK